MLILALYWYAYDVKFLNAIGVVTLRRVCRMSKSRPENAKGYSTIPVVDTRKLALLSILLKINTFNFTLLYYW